MADSINSSKKSSYPVGRADGLKMGSANTVYTTPDQTFGKYSSGYKDGDAAVDSASIFGGDVKH